jgi:DNA-binding NtrC family response regulator
LQRYSKIVLLVDDDPADQKLFSRELERHGFRVIITGVPENAMAAIVGGGIGCLVTDQVMPIAGGGELAKLAAGVRGDLCIIIFSGAAEPKEPIPAGTFYVSKDEPGALVELVTKCMQRWIVPS